MTATLDQGVAEGGARKPSARRGIARWARPGLGLLLPLGLALSWEIAVHLGLSNGRLVPPPSVIFATFADSGPHRRIAGARRRHALARRLGILFGVAAGTR